MARKVSVDVRCEWRQVTKEEMQTENLLFTPRSPVWLCPYCRLWTGALPTFVAFHVCPGRDRRKRARRRGDR